MIKSRLLAAIVRLSRYIRRRCLVCGNLSYGIHKRRYYYCSFSCGCYDGTMSVKVKDLPKPRILSGKHTRWQEPKEEKYL